MVDTIRGIFAYISMLGGVMTPPSRYRYLSIMFRKEKLRFVIPSEHSELRDLRMRDT